MRLPWTPALPVTTERLVLRAFRPDDLAPLLASQSRPENVRFVPYEPRTPETMAAALEAKLAAITLRQQDDRLAVAVATHDGVLVGDLIVMLHSLEHDTVEVGWIFDPDHGGQGYATESVAALLDLLVTDLGVRRITARVDARNTASRALCLRVGMRQESELVENEWFKGELTSECDYGLLARERVPPP